VSALVSFRRGGIGGSEIAVCDASCVPAALVNGNWAAAIATLGWCTGRALPKEVGVTRQIGNVSGSLLVEPAKTSDPVLTRDSPQTAKLWRASLCSRRMCCSCTIPGQYGCSDSSGSGLKVRRRSRKQGGASLTPPCTACGCCSDGDAHHSGGHMQGSLVPRYNTDRETHAYWHGDILISRSFGLSRN
jgi:hypothetical protein